MTTIKKIPNKTAVIINLISIGLALVVHLLVIAEVIPYTWINGGRSVTLEAQQQLSNMSVFILAAMALVNVCAAKTTWRHKAIAIVLAVLLWLLFAYSILGIVQQLFGTLFEKLCMSLLCIVNAVMYFRLALEKRYFFVYKGSPI